MTAGELLSHLKNLRPDALKRKVVMRVDNETGNLCTPECVGLVHDIETGEDLLFLGNPDDIPQD